MKALLQLIDSKENALKALKILNKKNIQVINNDTGEFLTEKYIKQYEKKFPLRMQSYGRGKSKSFDKIWSIENSESNQASFSQLGVFFRDDWASPESGYSLDDQKQLVFKLGGTVVDVVTSADIYVTNLGDDYQNKSYENIILINEVDFCKRVFTKSALAEPVSRSKSFKGDASRLWKLLSVRDLASIKQGLELATEVPEEIDKLIESCDIDKAGELIKSKRFTGSGPAQIYLDFVLFNLLSIAPNNSKAQNLRSSIKKISCNLRNIPKLVGFDELVELAIIIDNNNCVDMNLSNFGLMPKLQFFSLENRSPSNKSIKSLEGLNAPKLKKVVISSADINDISALGVCEGLEHVDVSANENLKSIDSLSASSKTLIWLNLSGCSKLQTINALQGALNLRHLDLSYCESLKSLEPLAHCKEFTFFDISGSGINSFRGLENIVLQNTPISYICKPKGPILLSELVGFDAKGQDSKFTISEFSIGKNGDYL